MEGGLREIPLPLGPAPDVTTRALLPPPYGAACLCTAGDAAMLQGAGGREGGAGATCGAREEAAWIKEEASSIGE